MSKAAQREEKQHWTVEKPKLDNARKWRGIYFIVTEEKEFKETHEKRAGFESSARFRKKNDSIFRLRFRAMRQIQRKSCLSRPRLERRRKKWEDR